VRPPGSNVYDDGGSRVRRDAQNLWVPERRERAVSWLSPHEKQGAPTEETHPGARSHTGIPVNHIRVRLTGLPVTMEEEWGRDTGSCGASGNEGAQGRSRVRCAREASGGGAAGREWAPNLPREPPVRFTDAAEGLSGSRMVAPVRPGSHDRPPVGRARSGPPASLCNGTRAYERPVQTRPKSLNGRTVNRLVIWFIV
jgi:hypothetical protein